jgi:hypothetical protein
MLLSAQEKMMAKLTDTQLIVLSNAAQRDDGAASLPDRMNKAAAAKVAASLVARKLMREVRVKPGMPIWRVDESGRNMGLVILRAGRNAIGVEIGVVELDEKSPPAAAPEGRRMRKANKANDAKQVAASSRAGAQILDQHPSSAAPRPGSKQALVVEMLSSEKGSTLDALVKATGWLPHTTRAALTGLRKKGCQIERQAGDGEHPSTWRIVTDKKLAA